MFLYGTELWSDSQGRKVWTAWDTQFVQRKVLLSGLCLPGSSLSRATHAFFSLFPPFPSCQDLPSSPVHAKAHIRLARSCRETFSQCGDFCTCLVLKENKMVLGRRKAAGWKDREKSGLSPKEPFQKPAILGEIYSPTNDHLATNLEDPGQVNKLWHWKLHLIFRFSFFLFFAASWNTLRTPAYWYWCCNSFTSSAHALSQLHAQPATGFTLESLSIPQQNSQELSCPFCRCLGQSFLQRPRDTPK